MRILPRVDWETELPKNSLDEFEIREFKISIDANLMTGCDHVSSTREYQPFEGLLGSPGLEEVLQPLVEIFNVNATQLPLQLLDIRLGLA
ncbi:hypothetical protein ASF83_14750 [Plantibacter sp. Leaf171]|nr:hypothetical protein ASE44_14765 [Plantibacter sp. Leaf1]KQR57448.1 hypothetical protein ASF83_14750 [Plantibacter sp. Leaf171]